MARSNTIQSFWGGSDLSVLEILSINSYLKNGHDYHLYAYSSVGNVPNGVCVLDANELIPFERIFLDSNGTWSGFSNWFRYKLLYEKGGWWSDLDVICLKNFHFKSNYVFSSECVPSAESGKCIIATSVIKSKRKAQFLLELLNYIEMKDHSFVPWGSFGPKLFNTILGTYDCSKYISSTDTFCPINWYDTDLLFSIEPPSISGNSYAIHLWNEIWRRKGINKNATFSSSSIIEFYKKLYL